MSRHDSRTHRDRVHAELLRLIVSTRLEPGSEISEPELMEKLGVGRTPLREALIQLRSEGLVEISPRRGTRVTDVGVRDVQLIFEARIGVERLVAGAAVARASSEHIRKIDSLVAQLRRCESADEQYRHDLTLHRLLLESAGNRYITDLYERLSFDATRLLHMSACALESLEHQTQFASGVRTALAERDTDALEELLVVHVEGFQNRLTQALAHHRTPMSASTKSGHEPSIRESSDLLIAP